MKENRVLTGLLTWERVDELIEKVRSLGPWYIHAPEQGKESLFTAEGDEAAFFLSERTRELKTRPHGPGWIYVHTPDSPSWIKIYDPCKCGSSCSMTTPKAWWEMELEDPSESLDRHTSREDPKNLRGWWKGRKACGKKV